MHPYPFQIRTKKLSNVTDIPNSTAIPLLLVRSHCRNILLPYFILFGCFFSFSFYSACFLHFWWFFRYCCCVVDRHPLFSLLALMLEKCEQATQGYIPKASSSSTTSSSSPNGTSNGESDSFTKDIQAFVQMLEKENRPLLTNNAELDGLVSVKQYVASIIFIFIFI